MKEFLISLDMKYKIAIIVGMLIIIITSFIFIYKYYYGDNKKEIITKEENTLENEELFENSYSKNNKISLWTEKKEIKVHVVGEVNCPGVVNLEEGARIEDAINLAGGTTENADISKINLAYVIEDGTQINIPSIGEENKNIIYIRDNAGENVEDGSASIENETKAKININSANLQKLQTIPGVGSSTAQKIIEYREQNGKFKSNDDIKNVSGIGEAKYEKLKNYITVK